MNEPSYLLARFYTVKAYSKNFCIPYEEKETKLTFSTFFPNKTFSTHTFEFAYFFSRIAGPSVLARIGTTGKLEIWQEINEIRWNFRELRVLLSRRKYTSKQFHWDDNFGSCVGLKIEIRREFNNIKNNQNQKNFRGNWEYSLACDCYVETQVFRREIDSEEGHFLSLTYRDTKIR